MSKTKYLQLSDVFIRDLGANSGFLDLRDSRYPTLRFRFLNDRKQGAWSVLHGGKWSKVASWPEMGCAAMFKRFPLCRVSLLNGGDGRVPVGDMDTVGQVLEWYERRQSGKAGLSKARKTVIKSVIRTRLLPALAGVRVDDLSKRLVFERLIEPNEKKFAVSYIRQMFVMLHAALRSALEAEKLEVDPLVGVLFSSYKLDKIEPRLGRLRDTELPLLVPTLVSRFVSDPAAAMLALLMLLFGLRVGETRQLRWVDFKIEERLLVVRAETTKTGSPHECALTDAALGLLSRYRLVLGEVRSVYLFPGVAGKPISSTEAGLWIRKLGGGAWSSHDFRKLAATCWGELGVDWLVGEALLNHAHAKKQQVYRQMDMRDLMRLSLVKWHVRLSECGLA
ncbi:tyrosine-type recombinase/integrase [Pseudomonas sp. S2_B07]